jgi:hypothetical protein
VAIDETRGHSYLTLAADADVRKVVFVAKGRDALTVAGFAQHLRAQSRPLPSTCRRPSSKASAIICPMSKSPSTNSTASVTPARALDEMRRREQKTTPLKGLALGFAQGPQQTFQRAIKMTPTSGQLGGWGVRSGPCEVWHGKMPSLFSDGLAISA